MNLARLLARRFEPKRQTLTDQDCMLYALGLGLGADPLDAAQLQYVHERDLKVFPSMASVIAHPGPWFREPGLEIDYLKLLHGEQGFTLHAPLRVGATYHATYRVLGVVDKGADSGALIYFEKALADDASGALAAVVTSTYFLRADGGCGGTGYAPPPAAATPRGDPWRSVQLATLPQAALIYRLSGDRNPIHADPDAARRAGFERPILHGLCTLGIATRAVLDACAGGDPARLASLSARFSAPVYPGDTLKVDLWRDGARVGFAASVPARNATVLRQGTATVLGA